MRHNTPPVKGEIHPFSTEFHPFSTFSRGNSPIFNRISPIFNIFLCNSVLGMTLNCIRPGEEWAPPGLNCPRHTTWWRVSRTRDQGSIPEACQMTHFPCSMVRFSDGIFCQMTHFPAWWGLVMAIWPCNWNHWSVSNYSPKAIVRRLLGGFFWRNILYNYM